MWIVRLALRRPYTIAVMSFLILLLGGLSVSQMIVDIFPSIDIPVVGVVWNYPGLSAEDMERRVVLISERAFSSTVNGISRIESESIPGIGLLRVYFEPGTDIGAAIAQISAVSNTILRIVPPGMTPPIVVQFNASTVPVAQLTLSSQTLPEEKIFDYGLNFIRISLFTIPGLSTPAPFGGKQRQVNIDIDPRRLAAKGLSPNDVLAALQAENVILPAGTARMGDKEYNVAMNSSPDVVAQFASLPIRVVGGQPVLIGDVAAVSDSYADQTNIVRVNGRRAAYLALLRKAHSSTLAVVDAVKEALPAIRRAAPEGLDIQIDFDQSIFVRAAISGVLREAVASSALVSLMIALFLGSWRSMIIVSTSIPLAIFCSILGLNLTGNTINIMTLGGLALAIGMLVDDATVEVENIHRNRHLGLPLTQAILTGAQQIAVPAIVATLAICIVFFPVVLLQGPARYLFVPLALSVVLAMLASYVLSRTLVPTLARLLMASESLHGPGPEASRLAQHLHRLNTWRDERFAQFQAAYGRRLAVLLDRPVFTMGVGIGFVAVTFALLLAVGTDFFPSVDVGLMKLHARAPSGTRIEVTEAGIAEVERKVREIVPPDELQTINVMIGLPVSYNLAFVRTDNVGAMDADVLIALKGDHHPTAEYMKRLRRDLAAALPGWRFFFQPADIVTQVLSFGLSAPIDVQILGNDLQAAAAKTDELRRKLELVPGLVDLHLAQVLDYPTFKIDVDRLRAAKLGLTQQAVANDVLVALSSSALVGPSYFLNPQNSVNYSVVVKEPLAKLDSVPALLQMPITAAQPMTQGEGLSLPLDLPLANAQSLSNLVDIQPQVAPSALNHYTVQRVLDLEGNVEGRDLGSVVSGIRGAIASLGKLPQGLRIVLRGQNEVMDEAFKSLGIGLILAIVLVYLLMVVLFQSWIDPFIIIMAVPGALVGILWMLALTHTTLNVESLMGSIMAVGIAVSNSILLVNFANDLRLEKGLGPLAAALEAGKTRLRPVLMTALAMIIGMVPMALALGEGGEQNAPLGRAVIGGLLAATLATLFLVPVVYSLLRRNLPEKHLLEARFLAEERGETFDPTQPLSKPEPA